MDTDDQKSDTHLHPHTAGPSAARYLLVLVLAAVHMLVYVVLSFAAHITSVVSALLNIAAYGAGKAVYRSTTLSLGRPGASQAPPARQPPA